MNIIHVGLGPAGREWLQALRGRRDVQSIACVDGDEMALAWARAQVTQPGKCGTRLEDALTGARADAAVIASPPLRRASDAVLALEAGLAVIVEAPIATTVADAARVQDAARRSGRPVVLAQRNRFDTCELTVRQLLRDGRIGAVTQVSCVDRRVQPAGGDPGARHAQLVHAAAPHFDGLCHILGVKPVAIMARSSRAPWSNYEHGSTTEAIVHMESAIHVQYHGSLTSDRNAHALWIDGEQGVLWTDRARVWWRKRGWPVFVPLLRFTAGDRSRSEGLSSLLDQVKAVNGGDQHAASLVDGMWTAAMLDAAMRSDTTGRAVQIDGILSSAGVELRHSPSNLQGAR